MTHYISTHFLLRLLLSSEVTTMWQINGTVHKLKPRSFYKSAHLWVLLVDFHLWCKLCLTVLSDYQVCYRFWAIPSAKPSVAVPSTKQSSFTFQSPKRYLSLTVTLQLQSHHLEHFSILSYISVTIWFICQMLYDVQNKFTKETTLLLGLLLVLFNWAGQFYLSLAQVSFL